VILEAPAKIVNGRTMVPLRLISEAFGAKVAWDDQSRLVRVATGGPTKEELVIALASYGTTPLPPDGLGVHNLVHVYEPLIFLNDKFELQPGLVTSWERVDDLTWRFKLRRGVKFHNGKDFDAEAAAFSIAHWLDSSVAYLKGRVSQMVNSDSFQVKDKYTLEVKTIKPCPQFPSFLTHNAVVAVEPGAFKNGEIVGTGPFKLLEIVKDQYVSVERFDDYWGKKPFFKRIVFKIVLDANTRLMALQKGEVDVVLSPPPPTIEKIKDDFNVVIGRSSRTACILFNHERPALRDVNVRKALCMAVDRNKIAKTIFTDLVQPAKTLIPPEFIYSAESEVSGYPYDPARARELLEKAGYVDANKDGFVDKDGKDLELDFPFRPEDEELAVVIADYFKQIGVKTKLTKLEVGAWAKKWQDEGDYDLTLYPTTISWGGPSGAFYDDFYSKSGLHYAKVISPEIDKLIEEGLEFESWQKYEEAGKKFKEVQKVVVNDLAVKYPLIYATNIIATKKQVKDLTLFPLGWMFFSGDVNSGLITARWVE
ncbi:MAG: ABC transporter substrate-binding protein, partial [Bacillota bacterium]|nr:ABC transporter substrate-binding protein [Bacillota bacterium]